MASPRAACLLCLLAGAAATLSDTVAEAQRGSARSLSPNRTAWFGDGTSKRSEVAEGQLTLALGGKVGYQAVRWTTSDITIPASLVREVCGSFPDKQTFTYSINEKWGHGARRLSAQGAEDCGARFVGGHWDPTAACSEDSANRACKACGTASGYRCSPSTFKAEPDSMGSFGYRFLNEHACELGDLSGMHGELEALDGGSPEVVAVRSLTNETSGLAQMSTAFGEVSAESVTGNLIGLNCDASGPPPVHATDCGCLKYNGKTSPSVGSMTVFRPMDHPTFYLAGARLAELEGRSIVVKCGSSFGDKRGEPLMCAVLS